MELLVTSDGSVPMVFLGLIDEGGGPRIKALHRFMDYWRGLEASPHKIEMSKIQEDALEVLDCVQVRTREATDAAIKTLTPKLVGPEVTEVTVWQTVPVPHCCLHMVMGNDHEPKVLWKELIGAIAIEIEDRLDEMKPLMEWMQAAVHKEEDEDTFLWGILHGPPTGSGQTAAGHAPHATARRFGDGPRSIG
jgi:hypothetical protein